MNYYKLLLLSFSIFICSEVGAQQVFHSLKEVITFSENNNQDLQIKNLEAQNTNYSHQLNKTKLLPQVKFTSSIDYNFALPTQLIPAEVFGGQPGTYRELQFGTKYNMNAGLEASMPLINTTYWIDVKSSAIQKEMSQTQNSYFKQKLEEQVAKGYYLCLISQEAFIISQNNLIIADSIFKLIEDRNSLGLMDPIDYNRSMNTYMLAQQIYEQNKYIKESNFNNLKLVMGINQSDSITLDEKLSLNQIENKSLSSNIDKNLSFQTQSLLLAYQKALHQKTAYKYLPEISLYARYNKQAQRNEFNFFNGTDPWFNIGVAGIRMDWPLFTGGNRYYNNKITAQKVKIQQIELEKEKQKIIQEDTELNLGFQKAQKNLTFGIKAYESGNKNMDIALTKYDGGVYSVDQYLNIWNESLQIQNNYLKALSDYYTYKSILDIKNKYNQ